MTDLNKKLKTIPSRRMSTHAVSGFTLIEVLVALVVMSVGMLGIAGLYVTSMQAGRTSLFHQPLPPPESAAYRCPSRRTGSSGGDVPRAA